MKIMMFMTLQLRYAILASFITLAGCGDKKDKPSESGYRLFSSQKPYQLFVSTDYPKNRSMVLASTDDKVVFSLDETKKKLRRANVSVNDISIGIELTENDTAKELIVIFSPPNKPMEVYQDMNLDGTWDVKRVPKEHQEFIFYNGEWLIVEHISGNWLNRVAQSRNIQYVFSRATGKWTLAG